MPLVQMTGCSCFIGVSAGAHNSNFVAEKQTAVARQGSAVVLALTAVRPRRRRMASARSNAKWQAKIRLLRFFLRQSFPITIQVVLPTKSMYHLQHFLA